MKTIQLTQQDHILIVKLAREVTNAINMDMINELSETLREAKGDPNVRGIVLTSAEEKFFSIGLAIPELYPLTQSEFTIFYRRAGPLSGRPDPA